MSWRQDLEVIESLGSKDQGPGSLAGLHEARKRHLAQFFTPLAVVQMMWAIAQQCFHHRKHGRINLIDTSIGTARTLHFADPERFHIGGVDIHEDVVSAVMSQAEKHQLSAEILCLGLQDIRPKGWDIALINPPYSINLQSAALKEYPCAKHGRLGPASAAQSDEYAVAQALDAASVVIAVVPASLAQDLRKAGASIVGHDSATRLRAIIKLSGKAFREEGADVHTCIVVYGHNEGAFLGEFEPASVQDLPDFDLILRETGYVPKLKPTTYNTAEPTVTHEVTGDRTVRVVHSGRKIGLLFKCGGTQARVLNAVYRERIFSSEVHRLPAGIKYAGQGLLDVQVMLVTDNPMEQFERLIATIREAGGNPVVDIGLMNYFKKLVRAKPRLVAPFGHWVYRPDHADSVLATARCRVPCDPKSLMAPAARTGQQVQLTRCDEGWEFTMKSWTRTLCDEEARKLFFMPEISAGWVQVHKPLQEQFPVMARQLELEAWRLNLQSVLSWEFQLNDLIEACIKPCGSVQAWKQGLGKSRLAIGLILLKRAKHGLVSMPACLLDEFGGRLKSAGLPESMWQTIECAEDLVNLRQINVISNERLRMPVASGKVALVDDHEHEISIKGKRSRNTYAKKLRGRIGVMVCDEGEFLANPESDQSRAVAQVSAKTVFPLSGTPQANYSRNLINLAAQSVGDGVVGQPYGTRHPMLEPLSAKTMSQSSRGLQVFADTFVSFEWTTNEFAETLTKGAKREVPKLRNLPVFRTWLAPFIKRRLQIEPEVQQCVQIPVPTDSITTLNWDDKHLAYYLRTADEFKQWYEERRGTSRASNFITLLARIGAVEQAAAFPQRPRSGVIWKGGLTAHQQYVVDRAVDLVLEGRKVVLFALWPELLELYRREINKAVGVEAVCYHGANSKRERRENIAQFRQGKADILLASFGITEAGLDLYEGNYVLLPHRLWNAKGEDQCIYRLLRPQQLHDVHVERVHIEGSIHEYQAQMCEWKQASADAGLDWGTPTNEGESFIHLETIIERFIHGLAERRGLKVHELRESIKALAA